MNPQIEDATTASRPAPGLMVRDQLGKTLFALAALGLPWVLIGAWSTHDLGFTVTAAGLIGGLLYVLAFVALFGLPNVLRANGYRRLAPWVLVGVVLEMIGTVTALPLLSHTDLVRLPVLGAAAVAVLLALAGLCLEATDLDLPVTNENTRWERSSVIVGLFGGFSVLLADQYLSTWPTAVPARLGLIAAFVVTLHLAWILTRDESDDDEEELDGCTE